MLRIGLTGGIGSGKTTVSDYFKSLYDITIIDADEISHQLISPEGDAYNDVISLFGETILEHNIINRKKIRDGIFSKPSLRKALENIIHPKVKQAILKQTEGMSGHYCLIVIPLLFESNMQPIVDRVLVVHTEKKLQISRVALRDNCTEIHVEDIIDSQLSSEQKLAFADDVIINNDTQERLIPQIELLHKKYLALSG